MLPSRLEVHQELCTRAGQAEGRERWVMFYLNKWKVNVANIQARKHKNKTRTYRILTCMGVRANTSVDAIKCSYLEIAGFKMAVPSNNINRGIQTRCVCRTHVSITAVA